MVPGITLNLLSAIPDVLNYLNNRNAWIKMASGVSIDEEKGKTRIRDIFSQTQGIESTNEDIEKLTGMGLAKNLVLFNTVQSINDYDPKKQQPYISRSGVRDNNTLGNSLNKMYGGLSDNSSGLQPVGGITGFTVESINRGSIRKASIDIKVYNKFQFNLIEILYLRLGYIMILEWGWDKYVSNINYTSSPPDVTIEQMGSTIIETEWFKKNTFTQESMLRRISQERERTQGNYDGFFGKVSNFSWKVNQDGSYDIKIDLITLGSIVESINIRKPAYNISTISIPDIQEKLADKFDVKPNDAGKYDNSLINNIGTNILSQWLGKTILDFPVTDNYFNLSAHSEEYANIKIPQTQRYYIRLGHFLNTIENKIFNNIENENCEPFKQVTIDTGEFKNRCNYILNLIPLDPGICVFDFNFSDDFSEASFFKRSFTSDVEGAGRNNANKLGISTKGTKQFVIKKEGSTVVYGRLMNIYMNVNFLQKELDNNLNDKGELSLFKYAEAICKGINRCTGGVTNIEPAIKDDNTLYFLEQNPIKGFDGLNPSEDTAPIEILGYSSKGESNFVKDFTFNTKITPDLMNMISLGAAAEGDAASIPFNNWNDGLDNRFEERSTPPIINPDEKTFEGKNIETGEGITDSKDIILAFQQQMSTKGDSRNVDLDGNSLTKFFGYNYNYDFRWKDQRIMYLGWDLDLTGNYETDVKNEDLLQEVVEKVQKLESSIKSTIGTNRRFVNGRDVTVSTILNGVNIISGEEYKSYILSAFGGDTGLSTFTVKNKMKNLEISKLNSLWFKSITDTNFINRGIDSLKKYVNDTNIEEYKEENIQSSTSGFIPVELDLTLEGLSGMKIYNKISINQRFLPPSYPKALKFVIRGVNHSVQNNLWETNIKTISTSITKDPPIKKLSVTKPQNTNPSLGPVKKVDDNDPLSFSLIKGLSLTADTSTGLIYYPEETTKTQITLHHTAVTNARIETIVRNWTKLNSKVSTHFIINRDGDYDQLFPLKYWGNHIGSSRKGNVNLQKSTISIELEGAGYLSYIDGSGKNLDGTFTNSAEFRQNQKTYKYTQLKGFENDIAVTQPVTMNSNGSLSTVANYRNFQYYHAYTTKQLDVLRQILQQIRSEYPNIPIGSTFNGAGTKFSEQFPSSGVQSEAAFSFNPGIYTHNSYRIDKSDVFPQKELIELLQEFN